MLSPTANEATPTSATAKERGKRIAEAELLSLMKEIKDEMRERDDQLREELR